MAIKQTNRLIDYLRRSVLDDGAERTDGQLLSSFIHHKDAAALATLIRRHGPMVWGVCRRMLPNHHDAEDAFQAVFLVLVQKAAALPDKEMVGNWLYGVAQQTAVRMRALAAKRGVRERHVAVMPEPTSAEQYVWNDLKPVLDEELSRLPDKYRVVIVLCDLEDRTRKEVARQLAIPEGTVASRLATARAMLAKRLAGRGVIISGGLLGALLAQQAASACLPMMMVSSTIKTATLITAGQGLAGAASPTVAALVTGVTKTMLVSKIKVVLAVVLVVGLALGGGGVGAGLFSSPMASAQQSGIGPDGDNSQNGHKDKPQSAPKVIQVRIAQPLGMTIALWPELGPKDNVVSAEAPGRLTLEQGKRSRLKLSGVPNRPGVELFPSVDVPRLAATAQEFVTSSAIPIDFTDEDFDTADKGGVTTKIVFLEKGRPTTLISHDGKARSLVEEASQRGTVLAVVRLGNILGVIEPVRQGEGGLVKIDIGDDGQLPVYRLPRADLGAGIGAPKDEKTDRLVRDLERFMRKVVTVQQENESLRQRVKQAEIEVRSLQASLADREEEIRKLIQELSRPRDKK